MSQIEASQGYFLLAVGVDSERIRAVHPLPDDPGPGIYSSPPAASSLCGT